MSAQKYRRSSQKQKTRQSQLGTPAIETGVLLGLKARMAEVIGSQNLLTGANFWIQCAHGKAWDVVGGWTHRVVCTCDYFLHQDWVSDQEGPVTTGGCGPEVVFY